MTALKLWHNLRNVKAKLKFWHNLRGVKGKLKIPEKLEKICVGLNTTRHLPSPFGSIGTISLYQSFPSFTEPFPALPEPLSPHANPADARPSYIYTPYTPENPHSLRTLAHIHIPKLPHTLHLHLHLHPLHPPQHQQPSHPSALHTPQSPTHSTPTPRTLRNSHTVYTYTHTYPRNPHYA